MEVFCHLCHYGINVPYHLDVKVEDFIGYLMENTQTGEKLKLPAMNGHLGVVGQTHDNQNYLCVNTYKIVDQLVKNDYSKLGIKIGLKFVGVPEVACIGIKPEIIPNP